MGHTKILPFKNLTRRRPIDKHRNFHTTPACVSLTTTKSLDTDKTLGDVSSTYGTHSYKVCALLTGGTSYIYFLAISLPADNPEINTQITSMLVQLNNDPSLNASIVEVLSLSLL